MQDPRSLKALAHPLRLELLELLRFEGPSTASALARRVGESSGATSYHLRQLARHGYIEEDERPAHGELGRLEVDVRPFQPEEFSPTHAGGERQRPQRRVPVALGKLNGKLL